MSCIPPHQIEVWKCFVLHICRSARPLKLPRKVTAFMDEEPRKVAAFASECFNYWCFQAPNLLHPYVTSKHIIFAAS